MNRESPAVVQIWIFELCVVQKESGCRNIMRVREEMSGRRKELTVLALYFLATEGLQT